MSGTKVKSAMMEAPAELTVRTTAGPVIHFPGPGKRVFVSAYAVNECRRHGCVVKATIKNTDQRPIAPGTVKSSMTLSTRQEAGEIEEVTLEEIKSESSDDPDPGDSEDNPAVYTEQEARIRHAIKRVVDRGDPEDFTEGKPKVSAVSGEAGSQVSSELRNQVWLKMETDGEVSSEQFG